MTERINVLGVGFDSLTMDEAVSRGMALMSEKKAAYVVTPNPEIVMLAREDPALLNADMDGRLALTFVDYLAELYGQTPYWDAGLSL